MSLRVFSLEGIDPKLNIIVGPNGSGKSSVFRAIRTLMEGTLCVGQGRPFDDGQFLCRHDSTSEEFEVAIDVEFDIEWERELIATYWCAALTHPGDVRDNLSHMESNAFASDEGAALYALWLLNVLRPETMPFLFRGELRFYYRHFVRDFLQLTYTFESDGIPLTIRMGPQYSHYGVFTAGYPPTSLSGNNLPVGRMMLDYWRNTDAYSEIRETILGKRIDAQVLPGSFDSANFVKQLAGANAVIDVKTIPRNHSPYPGPHKRLHELAGRNINDQQSVFTLAELFHVLLAHGIVMTSNFRHPPERVYGYAPQGVTTSVGGLYDDKQIPARLFDLKNGDHAARQTYCDIQKSFEQLVGGGLSFDVVTSVNEEGMSLEIWTVENGVEIPIIYHGAGIWEALVLSALLNDNTGKVSLLDEPASNLHANMQRKFLGMVTGARENQGGGQTLIVTHSQHLLPTRARDLPKVRRLQRTDSSTAVFGLGPQSEIPLDRLEKEMSDGSDMAGLLFASGVILVEGATETAAINVWYPELETSQGQTLADSNIALFSVGGVQGLPLHIQYLVEFGVPWVVICDADALDLRKRNDLWRKLVKLGILSSVPTQNVFDELEQTAAARGVFTANTSLEEKGFEDIPGIKEYVAAHDSELPDKNSKPRRGRYIALHLTCPDRVTKTIHAALAWVKTPALEEVSRRARLQEPVV